MSGFGYPTSRAMNQNWAAEFDDWNGDGVVDYPGGFYHSIGWDGHNGLDFLCPVGDPVYAANSGTVEFAGWAGDHWLLSGGGNAVMLAHPEFRVRTEYLHLSTVIVEPGQTVGKGQLLGYSGQSGSANGPHLHFGFIPMDNVDINNRMRGRINPWPYLNGTINTAAAIINYLQETKMATLDLDDLTAIQGFVNTSESRIIADNRAQIGFYAAQLAEKIANSEYQIKVFAQASDNFTGDRVIADNRAQEQATRDGLDK
jgi:Peptidase family M23